MGALELKTIIDATGGELIASGAVSFSGASIDSRTIKGGDIFFALKGDRFDGHDFLAEALKKGSGAVVSSAQAAVPAVVMGGKALIRVEDTLKALQGLARARRETRDIPVVGVTGTNGKTTTKEMAASILCLGRRVLKNAGNLNNQIGLPLSLLSLNSVHEAAVLEMGASRPGDIKELCDIASPGYGLITNIGYAHLEGFGDIDTLRKTKLELADSVGTLIINADDGFLVEGVNGKGFKGEVVKYSMKDPSSGIYASDVRRDADGISFGLHIAGEERAVALRATGLFNVYNALAASSVCHALGVGIDDIKKGLEAFSGVAMRFEVKKTSGVTVLSDVYNANPSSVEEALRELVRIGGKRTVAVLGDMLELGPYAAEAHRRLGALMSELGVGLFIAVGPLMGIAAGEFGGNKITVPDSGAARGILIREIKEGDAVLVKGSRGMKMEEVLKGAL